MKEWEYTEGPEALENVEQFASAILQAPKPKIKAKEAAKNCYSAQVQCWRTRLDDSRGCCVFVVSSFVFTPKFEPYTLTFVERLAEGLDTFGNLWLLLTFTISNFLGSNDSASLFDCTAYRCLLLAV